MFYPGTKWIGSFAVLILLQLLSCSVIAQDKGRKNTKREISACEGKLDILYAMVRSKVAYEKSRYRNEPDQLQKKQVFWDSLSIVNRHAASLESCITLLLQDSTYGRDKYGWDNKFVVFEYLDPLSSFVGPCAGTNAREFLKWTLFNFHEVKSDTSFFCPRKYKERKQ